MISKKLKENYLLWKSTVETILQKVKWYKYLLGNKINFDWKWDFFNGVHKGKYTIKFSWVHLSNYGYGKSSYGCPN